MTRVAAGDGDARRPAAGNALPWLWLSLALLLADQLSKQLALPRWNCTSRYRCCRS